jgi:lycopene cyclase domain-containing protein
VKLGQWSHLVMLLGAGVVFHAILWARNWRFLWSQRSIIARVVALAWIWTLLTDPIGGLWGAWYFDPNRILGIWILRYMPIEDLLGIAVVSSAAACAVLVFGYSLRRWIW